MHEMCGIASMLESPQNDMFLRNGISHCNNYCQRDNGIFLMLKQ